MGSPRTRPRHREPSLLTGLIFDLKGNRFVPTHSNKKGKRYRYYTSQLLTKPTKSDGAGPMRIPAHDVEQLVLDQLCHLLRSPKQLISLLSEAASLEPSELRLLLQSIEAMSRDISTAARALLSSSVTRIEVGPEQVDILLSRDSLRNSMIGHCSVDLPFGPGDEISALR